jgi:hypothetical protein
MIRTDAARTTRPPRSVQHLPALRIQHLSLDHLPRFVSNQSHPVGRAGVGVHVRATSPDEIDGRPPRLGLDIHSTHRTLHRRHHDVPGNLFDGRSDCDGRRRPSGSVPNQRTNGIQNLRL